MTPFRLMRGSAPLAALALSGCVGGLLGGGKPVQQYRFGAGAASSSSSLPSDGAGRLRLTLRPARFAAEIDGNRILTSTGVATAYLKDARWIAPAPSLFDAALRVAFRNQAPAIALVPAAEGAGAGCSIGVEVTRFEADFAQAGAVPVITVEANVHLEDGRRDVMAGRLFHRSVEAAGNGVSAVVVAFDGGSNAIVEDIARWIDDVGARDASTQDRCRIGTKPGGAGAARS